MFKLPVQHTDGSIDLIEVNAIFYLEAKKGDTLIQTRRKKPYRSVQRLQELVKKLPAPAFLCNAIGNTSSI
jgi:hypothetical protein